MKKIKLKDVSLAYKISIVAAFLGLIINFLCVFFVLLPIYDLANKAGEASSPESDRKLEQAENVANAVAVATYTLVAVSLISGSVGVYQDVGRKKSKAKS